MLCDTNQPTYIASLLASSRLSTPPAGPSTTKPPTTTTSTTAQPEDPEEPEEEEEDDFTIAWEILDLARTLFERRRTEEGEDVGRELGECLGLLGDVSLEGGTLGFFT